MAIILFQWEIRVSVLYKFSATEIRLLGRQMRPMNPPDDPRSYHRWSVWRPMDSLGIAENVFGMKVDRLFHRCTDIKRPLCLNKMQSLFGPFWSLFYWLHGLSRLMIVGLPRTETDHPTINHKWFVRRARILHFLQHCKLVTAGLTQQCKAINRHSADYSYTWLLSMIAKKKITKWWILELQEFAKSHLIPVNSLWLVDAVICNYKVTYIWVHIGSGNGLLPNGTKPMLTFNKVRSIDNHLKAISQ